MYKIPQIGGLAPQSDSAISTTGRTVYALYEADEALEPGSPVKLDTAGNTGGTLVIASDAAAEDYSCVGIYSGIGGSGVLATETGVTTLKDAADGDAVLVVKAGITKALVKASTTNVAAGDFLELRAATGARFYKDVTLGAKERYVAQALEAATLDNVAITVHVVNCM